MTFTFARLRTHILVQESSVPNEGIVSVSRPGEAKPPSNKDSYSLMSRLYVA